MHSPAFTGIHMAGYVNPFTCNLYEYTGYGTVDPYQRPVVIHAEASPVLAAQLKSGRGPRVIWTAISLA